MGSQRLSRGKGTLIPLAPWIVVNLIFDYSTTFWTVDENSWIIGMIFEK
jgi:hypothetical protein